MGGSSGNTRELPGPTQTVVPKDALIVFLRLRTCLILAIPVGALPFVSGGTHDIGEPIRVYQGIDAGLPPSSRLPPCLRPMERTGPGSASGRDPPVRRPGRLRVSGVLHRTGQVFGDAVMTATGMHAEVQEHMDMRNRVTERRTGLEESLHDQLVGHPGMSAELQGEMTMLSRALDDASNGTVRPEEPLSFHQPGSLPDRITQLRAVLQELTNFEHEQRRTILAGQSRVEAWQTSSSAELAAIRAELRNILHMLEAPHAQQNVAFDPGIQQELALLRNHMKIL